MLSTGEHHEGQRYDQHVLRNPGVPCPRDSQRCWIQYAACLPPPLYVWLNISLQTEQSTGGLWVCSCMKCSWAFPHFMMVRLQPHLALYTYLACHFLMHDILDVCSFSSPLLTPPHRDHQQDVRKDPVRSTPLPR